jgi:hypothetical protein
MNFDRADSITAPSVLGDHLQLVCSCCRHVPVNGVTVFELNSLAVALSAIAGSVGAACCEKQMHRQDDAKAAYIASQINPRDRESEARYLSPKSNQCEQLVYILGVRLYHESPVGCCLSFLSKNAR